MTTFGLSLKTLGLFATLIVAVGCGAARNRNRFLEATVPITDSQPGYGCTTSVPPRRLDTFKQFPLRAHLLATDRTSYRRMEQVIYDVRVTNVSDGLVIVPWSAAPVGDRDRATSGARHALFDLRVVDSVPSDFVLDTATVYGSEVVPLSLKRLAPGESVVFRLAAWLSGNGRQDATNPVVSPPRQLRVRVGMSICAPKDDPLLSSFHDEVSENALSIRILETVPAVAPPAPYDAPPQIESVSPSIPSPGTMIEVKGYRLGVDRQPQPTVHFTRAGIDLSAERRGSPTKDRLWVWVPPDVTHGEWQIVVDRNGVRGDPFTVSVNDEWMGPSIDWLFPTHMNPEGYIYVSGSHFRSSDVVEIVDANGRILPVDAAFGQGYFAFLVPNDMPEGGAAVRVRSKTPVGEIVSGAHLFFVTLTPLPLDVLMNETLSVAPGQWTDLIVTNESPLNRSERTEVQFVQGAKSAVVATYHPTSTHVQIPKSFAAGPVVLRTRTWRSGMASHWSRAHIYVAASKPALPQIDLILVGPSRQSVDLSDGPEKPDYFRAAAGDELILHGRFPSDLGAVDVTLVGAGRLTQRTCEDNRGFDVCVRLPGDLQPGSWRLSIGAKGMPTLQLPIVMEAYRLPR